MSTKSQIETRKQYKNKEVKMSATAKAKTGQGNSSNQQDNQQNDTVYLEPWDYEKPTIRHPVSVGKALSSKGIKTYTDITAIGRFRFKISFGAPQEVKKLMEINMEELNLKCYVPIILRQTVGLAKGIPRDYSEQELMEDLLSEGEIIKVERMKKMDRNKKLTDTENVKIIFRGKQLPDSVSLYGCRFKIELYLFPVKQCSNCWGFGHRREKCWRTTKCKECGVQHEDDNCRQKACINCGGSHSPTDSKCPEKEKQVQINAGMQLEKLTYKEANEKWRQANQFDLLSNFDEEFQDMGEQRDKQCRSQRNANSSQYKFV
ncbi:uncharacterized protein LOC135713809 [Ochlerotatus camptorhynchus]|uniref:uncharacterized protein LOC135713809 n=1 Tax=Ochlerotatus camptorhynchus TaxID=644619 RepID=UPI0031D36908